MHATWKRCQADVSNDYPLLMVLEADYPQLVKAAQRQLTEKRLQTLEEQWKREHNPDYADSKAYQRAARHLRRAQAKGGAKLAELADVVGLRREVFGLPSDVDKSSASQRVSTPPSLKEEFLHQVRDGCATQEIVPPYHHLLVALEYCREALPEEERKRLHLSEGSTFADAAENLLMLPRHVRCDLHGYRVDQATEVADRWIREAWKRGYGYVTLIHGSPEVTDPSAIRSLAKGGIKWSLRDRFSQGGWDEYIRAPESSRHRIADGAMTMAIMPQAGTLAHDDCYAG